MNAAARLFNQGAIARGWAFSLLLARTNVAIVFLTTAILVSALAVVYVTNLARSMHADVEQTLLDRDQMHIAWGQLLLEKSTWMTQAHVQQVAEKQLKMAFPNSKSVVIINTKKN